MMESPAIPLVVTIPNRNAPETTRAQGALVECRRSSRCVGTMSIVVILKRELPDLIGANARLDIRVGSA